MAGLVIPSSVTVPVAPGGATREFEEVGDRNRTFSGDMRSTIRAWKDNWRIRTAPMATGDAASIVSSLQGTQPMACYGTIIGVSSSTTSDFHGELVREELAEATTGKYVTLEFRLLGA